jgi:hypothetical protein
MRRRAALNMRKAIGSSMTTAEAMLIHMPLVPRSRITSNHASQHNSDAVTSRQAITIWRPRQNAQPVAAKAASSTMSNPTQANRQCVAVYSRRNVSRSTMIQPMSTVHDTMEKSTPSLRPRLRLSSRSGWG